MAKKRLPIFSTIDGRAEFIAAYEAMEQPERVNSRVVRFLSGE
jgi:hypothetical protein